LDQRAIKKGIGKKTVHKAKKKGPSRRGGGLRIGDNKGKHTEKKKKKGKGGVGVFLTT